MPQDINLSTEDIKYSESILLPKGDSFNPERLDFITNYSTIDLQAVPGSGKTTALLAKLLILEKKLPLENNRAILILSHTNKSVDEIKDRIGIHCPKLFSYPNFIGTIQSFVDQFLAIPYINNYLGIDIKRVDSEIFKEQLWREFKIIAWSKKFDKPEGLFWGKFGSRAKDEAKKKEISEKEFLKLKTEEYVKDIYFDFNDEKIKVFKDDSVVLATKTNKKYKGIKECVLNVLNNGFVSYEYAYKMGLNCISVYPKMKLILQERFKYVFVDEMQDMDTHQYMLLETIFYDEGNSKSEYQRIGDINQAIYNGEVYTDDIWKFRGGKPLVINGSHRLSPNVAELVDCFTLNRDGNFQIEGKNVNNNLKPCLIVFETNKIREVIPKFSQIVKSYIDSGEIIMSDKSNFKAIGWVKNKEGQKLGITDYSNRFKPQSTYLKIDFDNLYSYLTNFNKEKRTLAPIRKNIMNALIKILRIENIRNSENRYFSKKQLLKYLLESHENEYNNLKRNLFEWSMDIIKGKPDNVYNSIKTYITKYLNLFNKEINKSDSFINNIFQEPNGISCTEPFANNTVNYDGFDIDISTVHSVKGQTHTATLYLETSYQNGNDTYETQRLSSQLKYNDFNEQKKYHIQSTKMAYVGFSRPTDLLCLAVSKNRFEIHLHDIDRDKWNVINI